MTVKAVLVKNRVSTTEAHAANTGLGLGTGSASTRVRAVAQAQAAAPFTHAVITDLALGRRKA